MKKTKLVMTEQELLKEYQLVCKGRMAFMRKPKGKAYRCEFCLCWHKAGDQAELTASENTIRKTHAALHANDGVRWAVVASESADITLLYERKLIRGKGTNRRLYPKSFESLEQFGAVVIELPEQREG